MAKKIVMKKLKKSPKVAKAPKKVAKAKKANRSPHSRKQDRKERAKKANVMAKEHRQKLLDAKLYRQRQRNRQMIRMRRRNAAMNLKRRQGAGEAQAKQDAEEDEALVWEQQMKEDSIWFRFRLAVQDILASLFYFLTVTLRSERTLDWLVFLANNLGLYQEYEINDYGQRLSPRTGRPVILSLGLFRVVQVVESANQVRSHWDPYIREFLRNSKLTTDCWRANRMAMQVALCMDETGQMFDMPIAESAMVRKNKQA